MTDTPPRTDREGHRPLIAGGPCRPQAQSANHIAAAKPDHEQSVRAQRGIPDGRRLRANVPTAEHLEVLERQRHPNPER